MLLAPFALGAISPVCMAQGSRPAPAFPAAPLATPTAPLLDLRALSFLEGKWNAESRDGRQQLGVYSWDAELNGHVLARHGSASSTCLRAVPATCEHADLLYVFQDSAGAPLRAIYFDNEGHVIRYEVSVRHEDTPSGGARRDLAIFLSDAAALGPRYRLTYERNSDLQTGATILTGRFEVLLQSGEWRTYMAWSGKKL